MIQQKMKQFFTQSYSRLYIWGAERNLPTRPKMMVLKEIVLNLARIIFRLHN